MATFTAEIDVSVDEFLDELTQNEREELYLELCDEFSSSSKEQEEIVEYLRKLPPFELKKILCNVFYLPSYYANDALRTTLEPIITAQ